MTKENLYLSRYSSPETLISTPPSPRLGICVVIPAHNEQSLITSVSCLLETTPTSCDMEIIVVFNASENAPSSVIETNNAAQQELETLIKNSSGNIPIHIITKNDLPKKHAGVGLARKIGMDEAYRRFLTINNLNKGIIACYDADSKCESNYLIALEQHFQNNNKGAVGLHFEHPLKGKDYPEDIYYGITLYELHLRYYLDFLRFIGHPHAYQTIGSSMAVNAKSYGELGGMNRRKAGEDFYFLQKFIERGQFSEIKNTKIIPSPRTSDRVPFGTGKAMGDYLINKQVDTYSPQTFLDLQYFINSLPELFKTTDYLPFIKQLPTSVSTFLKENHFETNLNKILSQSPNFEIFESRFFSWFNGFAAMKFMHFSRDNFHPNEDIVESALFFLKHLNIETEGLKDAKMVLEKYREIHLKDII